MNIVLGGTGHVGAATARALLARGEPVTVVTREAAHATALKQAGAEIAEADVRDVQALRAVFRQGRRAFLLNPPAAPSTDTDAEERANLAGIVEALAGSKLEKVVLASAYGARPGQRCGDLTVLYELERRVRAQPIPAAINRGAYYLSNWDGLLDDVRATGVLRSFFPANLSIPMVAPADLGEIAARRLLESKGETALRHVEGPQRYTPQDVADAYAQALGIEVRVESVPAEAWERAFRELGFSEAAAKSYACMTATVVEDMAMAEDPLRGSTTLQEHIRGVVESSRAGAAR